MDDSYKEFNEITDKLKFSTENKETLFYIIEPILRHEEWIKLHSYKHHLDSRAKHLIDVCCRSWLKASKKKKYDANSVAIGALLHDFFLYDWQDRTTDLKKTNINNKTRRPKVHAFIHPIIALDNAYQFFPDIMNDTIKDIIMKHMWPLTGIPPKYKESWLVCSIDKKSSLNVVKHPKELPMYIGFRKKERKS